MLMPMAATVAAMIAPIRRPLFMPSLPIRVRSPP
jgi:hypothetical protein